MVGGTLDEAENNCFCSVEIPNPEARGTLIEAIRILGNLRHKYHNPFLYRHQISQDLSYLFHSGW